MDVGAFFLFGCRRVCQESHRRQACRAALTSGRRARPARCLRMLLVCTALTAVAAKPKKHGGGSASKAHWKKESECAKSICKDFHTDENDDCLAACVSQSCHAEVYAADPLEPGEVDRERQTKFNGCVKREQDEEKKQKAQEKRDARNR
ncbi:unnamed protein product [Prorocentrum cordatum]|uniref:Uncharacterized protein n=1 Tax=Prorocentrum cordatum TaxID=2364126 RepID=A0ABN9VDJ0_9DINO|nr:unnamed protein product [Polarella glacialis]